MARRGQANGHATAMRRDAPDVLAAHPVMCGVRPPSTEPNTMCAASIVIDRPGRSRVGGGMIASAGIHPQ
jgi:hypothetical protein